MKAQGTVDPCNGHLSPLGQKARKTTFSLIIIALIQPTDLTALLDDGVPAACKAELVSNVAGALNKVSVLKFAPAVCTL